MEATQKEFEYGIREQMSVYSVEYVVKQTNLPMQIIQSFAFFTGGGVGSLNLAITKDCFKELIKPLPKKPSKEEK